MSPSSEAPVTAFEKLGVFYLGRPYDVEARKPREGLLLYESKDLVTHAFCVGMTGSGKTGLCLALVEEAALDHIPAILIDPKGDLGNLLLTFPRLRPEDFAPWINEDDARRRGLSAAEYASQQAELWAKGLAAWGQDGERIRRLREAADLTIYTPGSNAGRPLSIVRSFSAPPPEIRDDAEALRERLGVTATGLLGLLGIAAYPVQSREHILVSTILDAAWREGRDLDLAGLIHAIQQPPVTRVGVMELEAFYPARERFELVMALNNLLASPGFAGWMEGEPLDVGALLHTPAGRPRLSIVSIAHLGDGERMFLVTLLLNEITGWMRRQSGTTSLRAILYMDDIFGFFPPVANPPSKQPLLTLLKQARAFGLGVVLATQNPVDLDYKGLANAGTWFIGRLQTERDKLRVLEGLEGAVTGAGQAFDRGAMDRILSGLGTRIFLMHNVHEDSPEVFETRWAMSYLRGPLTRDQIKRLIDPQKRGEVAASRPTEPAAATAPAAATGAARPERDTPVATPPARATAAPSGPRPVLPAEIPQHFVAVRGEAPAAAEIVYEPMLLGMASVRFTDAKRGVDRADDLAFLVPITDEAIAVDWERGEPVPITASDLEAAPVERAHFAELPAAAGKAKSYPVWSRDFSRWLHRSQALELSKVGREVSRPGESERDFRARLVQAARERRDADVARLRRKYAPRIDGLREKIRRAEEALARESEQATQSQLQTAISVGATLLGALIGRKAVSASTIGRATTAARGAGRVLKERGDVGRAQQNLETFRQQLADLEAQCETEVGTLGPADDPLEAPLETVRVQPTRQNIAVRLVTLAWTPEWQDSRGGRAPAWR
jgi:hypothetical protein